MFEDGNFSGVGYVNVSPSEIKDFFQQNVFLAEPRIYFKYVGEWKEGKFDGRGKLVTKDEIYTGGFTNGLFEGEGKLMSMSSKV